MDKYEIAGVSVGMLVLAVLFGWIFTAPYLSNQGLGRTPGLIIGGTLTDAPTDFTDLNDSVQGPMMMKQSGFPPFVHYLSWVGTEEGVISATRPDGGLWAKRVRERGGNGFLRIGEETYAMEATEILDNEVRLAMMAQWAARSGRTLDEPLYPGSEPLNEWEVFFWTPRDNAMAASH
ncbi:MAG: hypothetical protein GKR91_12390 [Pseudomonadales bacterium]|nr:hypothetical protein [Pseudomonadales bacterium]